MTLRGQGIFLSLLLLCSCATENSIHPRLPADVTMNKDAGRGGLVVVTLRLASGEGLPFVVDTGSPVTFFEKSQTSKLGACLDSGTLWNFGVVQEAHAYAAPKLYLGRTLLLSGSNVVTFDYKQLESHDADPIVGLLGMDVLKHYCIQL